MSYCKEYGKDQVIFLTEEDAAKPSSVELAPPNAEDVPQGLITESGEINWNCPCLGGMAVGPCGVEFRDAFSCFHYSEADPKGSECFEKFVVMQECMKSYPELYDKHTRDDDDDDEPQSKKENSESPKEEPEKLEKPEQLEKPSNEENQAQPEKPVEPEQLEKPANEEDQAQPEEPQKSEETDKTGSEDVATDNKSESVEESNEKKAE